MIATIINGELMSQNVDSINMFSFVDGTVSGAVAVRITVIIIKAIVHNRSFLFSGNVLNFEIKSIKDVIKLLLSTDRSYSLNMSIKLINFTQ